MDGEGAGGARSVRLGVAIPQFFWPGLDLGRLQDFLARAEALGVHSAWVQEGILGEHGSLEPVTLLAYAAAATRRLGLGVAVLLTPLRNPVQLAKSLASVDQLSGGRLIVGVGLGGQVESYPAFGIEAAHRVARFTEGLETMKRLWTEERVSFRGRFWTLEGASMAPKPVQKPHPPVWIGGHHPNALRRAAVLGDGFIGGGAASTEEFRGQVGLLRRSLREAGRDATRFAIAKRVYLLVERDRAAGLRRLREWFGRYYGNASLADRVAVVGDVPTCVTELREVIAAGADLLLLNFVFDEFESLELVGREIAPALAEA